MSHFALGVPARYRMAELPEYQSNPLIEALPPIYSEIEAKDLLKYAPVVDEHVRTLPMHIRMHAVINAADFFLPQPLHLDLEQRFSRLIRGGYRNRNPVLPGYWPATNHQIAEMRIRHRSPQPTGPQANLPHVSTSRGMSIVGVSGIGKTTALKRILSLYPQVIIHSSYHRKPFTHCQIVWLRLEMPRNGRLSDLVKQFFQSLDQTLGTTYYHDFIGRSRRSIEEFVPDMANLALKHSIGVLVIDEIQNLVNSRGTTAAEMLSFLVELDNTIGIPIVLVGTPKARPILQSEFRSARRASGQGDMEWQRMMPGAVWEAFVKHLWHYQFLQTYQPETTELRAALYEESQGITDLAVKLYLLAQIHLMAENSDDKPLPDETPQEILTPVRFRRVAQDYLRLVQPFLEALRKKDKKNLIDLGDVDLPELGVIAEQIKGESENTNAAISLNEEHVVPTNAEERAASQESVAPKKRRVKKTRSARAEGDLRAVADAYPNAQESPYTLLQQDGVTRPMDVYVDE